MMGDKNLQNAIDRDALFCKVQMTADEA